jgi:hypothetical protein
VNLPIYPDEYDAFIRSAIDYKRYCFEMIFNTSASKEENLLYFHEWLKYYHLERKLKEIHS